ncbi:uncharacterized protein LOC110728263 [Chenopodium quinoa]|uniref:uncharacterized protein LOC110728263 n=1 Tax=Chenopodium quinoa TaxID=63459 RepID=UPI000B779645|nr:uncharacterized protein LOC110728263 [Chenopodium quinoa]
MDVDNTTSEARAHESINHASERANSTSKTPIVPLEPSSCENLQGVGENISIVAPTPRRSARIRNKQFVEVLITEDSEIFLLENEEPTTYKKALVSPNLDKWLDAMKSEMESMSENEVWTLVDLPDGVKPIDDILLMENDIPMFESVKEWLKSCFSMKDLGNAEYILGIKIHQDRSRRMIRLSQETYIDKVLDRFEMTNSKRGFLPMSHGITLSKSQCTVMPDEMRRMAITPYASAIGSIMYAMICYTDASFLIDSDDFRSQSGYIFCLNGGAVSWKSSKQSTVADSTIESEHLAAVEAAKEAVWIKKFLTKLDIMGNRNNDDNSLPPTMITRLNFLNFNDWESELRSVLKNENLEFRLDLPIEGRFSPSMTLEKHLRNVSDYERIAHMMLSSIPED